MVNEEYFYLDHAATTPMRDSAFEAYRFAETEAFANSSGGHTLSRKAKNLLEDSREIIAKYFGAAPNEITFTSGGTEADNWVIKSSFQSKISDKSELITTSIEHEAVLASAEWVRENDYIVHFVSSDLNGVINTEELLNKVNEHTKVVSVMYANNETGIVQPVKTISEQVRKINPNILFHSDVVQAVATENIDFHNLGIDSAAISGHKIGAPKGIGVMFLSSKFKLPSFLHGGKQELERRAGTVNVSGVAGLAAAVSELEKNISNEKKRIESERKSFEDKLYSEIDVKIIGKDVTRLSHISNIQFKNINSETLMIALDLKGMGVSRGSACASGAQKPSHVLKAMNISENVINNHLRFSFGWTTRVGDGLKAADMVISSVKELA